MTNELHELKWNAIAYGVTASCTLCVLFGMWYLVPPLRRSWFPLPRLRPGSWTGSEVLLAMFIFFGVQILAVELLSQAGFFDYFLGPRPDEKARADEMRVYIVRSSAISSPLTLTLILGLLFAVLFARTRTRPHHYGLTWARWPANASLGLAGFVIATPIVLGVFAGLGFLLPSSEHGLTLLGKQEPAWWEWTLMGFQAIVAAPIAEEVVFRGIVQGWLRRTSLSGHLTLLTVSTFLVAINMAQFDPTAKTWDFNYEGLLPTMFVSVLALGYGYWMYRLARQFELGETAIQHWQPAPESPSITGGSDEEAARRQQTRDQDDLRQRRWADANSKLAIFGSALLFAITHSAWPAPVPLFLLGLVLGWLAYRTQSLVGPITLHALFNLTSFIALYGSVATTP